MMDKAQNVPASWKHCNTCKKEIPFRSTYYACSVSTCKGKGTSFAFCSVGCWSGHISMFNHRKAYAEEETAPAQAA